MRPSLLILGIVVLSLAVVVADAQQQTIDSLRLIIQEHKNTRKSLTALVELGTLLAKADPQQAIRYLRAAASFSPAQGNENEICRAANAVGSLYHQQSAYDSSFFFHHKALALAQRFLRYREVVLAYQGLGENFLRQSKSDSALAWFQRALPLSLTVGDASLEAGIFNNLGNVFLDKGRYADALNQFIRSAKLYDSAAHDENGLAKALSNIGNIEFTFGHNDKAMDYANRSLKLSVKNGNQPNIAYLHRLMGRISRKQGNSDRALNEYQQAIQIYHQIGDRRNSSETAYAIGNIYFDLKQFHSALVQYDISLRISRSISNPLQMAYTYSGIGYSWYALKDFSKSIIYFDSSLTYARKIGNRYLAMDAYEVVGDIYVEEGRFKDALRYHKYFSSLRDSIHEDENRTAAEELEVRYENNRKQNEIELLQKDRQIQTAAFQQQRIIQVGLGISISLILVIGFLLFNRYRILQESQRRREVERVRNQLARDLHDDIGSALSSINIISQIAVKESGSASALFQRISDQSTKMMENMTDIVWSINPGNDALEKIVVRMKEFAAEILEPKNIEYQFTADESMNDIVLDSEKRKNLFLVFKEAINNTAKYSNGNFVDVQLRCSGNALELDIKDNGKGFDPLLARRGNGLKNMQQRTAEMNGNLAISSASGEGTRVTLTLAIT